jgi:hypothetical protein
MSSSPSKPGLSSSTLVAVLLVYLSITIMVIIKRRIIIIPLLKTLPAWSPYGRTSDVETLKSLYEMKVITIRIVKKTFVAPYKSYPGF